MAVEIEQRIPITATNVSGWDHAANAQGPEDLSVAASDSVGVNTIALTGFGFGIPSGVTVVGITVEAYCGT